MLWTFGEREVLIPPNAPFSIVELWSADSTDLEPPTGASLEEPPIGLVLDGLGESLVIWMIDDQVDDPHSGMYRIVTWRRRPEEIEAVWQVREA